VSDEGAPRVLITGATGVIGRALAEELASLGVRLLLTGRSPERLEELASALPEATVLAADLADDDALHALFARVDELWGGLDALIHNAASPVSGLPVDELTHAESKATFASGPLAALHLIHHAAPRMGPGSRILLASSGAGHRGVGGLAAYSGAKFALEGIAQATAEDLFEAGIAVNTISLPTVRSPLSEGALDDEVLNHAVPASRAIEPFLFALSFRAAGITGRALTFGEPFVRTQMAPPLLRAVPAPRVPFLPRSRRELKRDGVAEPIAKVDLGEPADRPSTKVEEAVAEWMASDHPQEYPDARSISLRHALARRHDVGQDSVLCGPGSSAILSWIVDLLLDPGDEVLSARPCFALWPWLVRSRGRVLRELPAAHPDHDLDAFLAAVGPQTRLIYLDSPGNPRGSLVRERDFGPFLRALPRHVFVVVDHAYRDFVTEPDALDAASLDWVFDPRVLCVRTLSKTHSLAGWRVGYLVAHPETVNALQGAVAPFSLSSPAQAAALAALRDEDHAREVLENFATERAFLFARLDALGLPYFRSQTSFVCLPWPGVSTMLPVAAKAGVALAPPADDDALQFAIRSREDNERVLQLIEEHHPALVGDG
jgi:histidinol-phosphate aminotransferase